MKVESIRQCRQCIGFGCRVSATFVGQVQAHLTSAMLKCAEMQVHTTETCECCSGYGFHRT